MDNYCEDCGKSPCTGGCAEIGKPDVKSLLREALDMPLEEKDVQAILNRIEELKLLEQALLNRIEQVKKRKLWPEHLKSAILKELEMVLEDRESLGDKDENL